MCQVVFRKAESAGEFPQTKAAWLAKMKAGAAGISVPRAVYSR